MKINRGLWNLKEKQEFETIYKKYKLNLISKRQLFSGIKSRTPKQVYGHLKKLKYKLDSNKNRMDIKESDQINSDRAYIEFSDSLTGTELLISESVMQSLIVLQRNDIVTLTEKNLKLIAEKRFFYDMIKKKIQEEKNLSTRNNSKTSHKTADSLTSTINNVLASNKSECKYFNKDVGNFSNFSMKSFYNKLHDSVLNSRDNRITSRFFPQTVSEFEI